MALYMRSVLLRYNDLATIMTPEPFLDWHHNLIAQKYDSTGAVSQANRDPANDSREVPIALELYWYLEETSRVFSNCRRGKHCHNEPGTNQAPTQCGLHSCR